MAQFEHICARAERVSERKANDAPRLTAVRHFQKRDEVARMHALGVIGSAQYKAALTLRALVDQLADDGVPAMDPSRVIVDGGGAEFEPPRLRQAEARAILGRIARVCGASEQQVMTRIVVEGETLQSVALAFETDDNLVAKGACSRQTRDYVSRLLRDGLRRAAGELNLVYRAPSRRDTPVSLWIAELAGG